MTISTEQLITELTIENADLKYKLQEAENELRNFEVLAQEWKRAYSKMEMTLKVKIEHLQQTIEEVDKEAKGFEEKIKE